MAEDNVDIFKFSGSRKVKLGAVHKRGALNSNAALFPGRVPPLPRPGRASFRSSDSASDGDEGTSNRRPGRRGRKASMAASRLLKRPNKDTDSSDDSDDVELVESSKRAKQTVTKESRTPSPSPPRCPSPLPSPPPPGSGIMGIPSNDKSRKVLNQANDVLHRLWYATPASESSLSEYHSDLIDLATTQPAVQSMNLRVRYKGKVRKYPINRFDTFSNVITLLAKELEGVSDDKVLLSHKATTIRPTDSPSSLGLTTADIIDAVIMTESANSLPVEQEDDSANAITIKVQTSSHSMKYSIGSGDPLRKVMIAFASKLDISLRNLKFLFDGSIIQESQTPLDLDMEEDDCIDVAVRQ